MNCWTNFENRDQEEEGHHQERECLQSIQNRKPSWSLPPEMPFSPKGIVGKEFFSGAVLGSARVKRKFREKMERKSTKIEKENEEGEENFMWREEMVGSLNG